MEKNSITLKTFEEAVNGNAKSAMELKNYMEAIARKVMFHSDEEHLGEIIDTAWIKLSQNIDKCDPSKDFKNFVYVIVEHEVKDFYSKEKKVKEGNEGMEYEEMDDNRAEKLLEIDRVVKDIEDYVKAQYGDLALDLLRIKYEIDLEDEICKKIKEDSDNKKRTFYKYISEQYGISENEVRAKLQKLGRRMQKDIPSSGIIDKDQYNDLMSFVTGKKLDSKKDDEFFVTDILKGILEATPTISVGSNFADAFKDHDLTDYSDDFESIDERSIRQKKAEKELTIRKERAMDILFMLNLDAYMEMLQNSTDIPNRKKLIQSLPPKNASSDQKKDFMKRIKCGDLEFACQMIVIEKLRALDIADCYLGYKPLPRK